MFNHVSEVVFAALCERMLDDHLCSCQMMAEGHYYANEASVRPRSLSHSVEGARLKKKPETVSS